MVVHSKILKKHFDNLGFDDKFFDTYELAAIDKMQNIDTMCEMLYSIQQLQSKMVICTDFDVDGIMSSIIAYAGFSELGFNVSLFKPTPSLGYGFHIADVDNILIEFPDVNVIFTGDVGISSNEAISYAQSKGIIVLVTDHHIGNERSVADIAVNPNQLGETYSHNGICGSYVVYKILEDYCKKYCIPTKSADIYRLQMFAGVATISDVMPLMYENRQLVRNSISIMRYFYNYELNNNSIAPPVYSDNYSRAFVGMKKLLEYFRDMKKIKTTEDITEQFYGFYLVPFLNSCKRMGGDMRGVYDIFFSEFVSPLPGFENMSCVETGIKYVAILSERRKTLTSEYFAALFSEKEADVSERAAFMHSEVYITDAIPGLCGLLATKLMNLTGLPTLVVNRHEDGSFSGSGRCPVWLDLAAKLQECNLPIKCDGHKEAFGVKIPDENALHAYENFFTSVILSEYARILSEQAFSDVKVTISNSNFASCDFSADTELINDYLTEKQTYCPFGNAFPEPYFAFYIDIMAVTTVMFGQKMQHIKLITENGIEILLFNQALDFTKLVSDNKDKNYLLVCYGTFQYDTYNKAEYDSISFFGDDIDIMEM